MDEKRLIYWSILPLLCEEKIKCPILQKWLTCVRHVKLPLPVIARSKLIIETQGRGVKYVHSVHMRRSGVLIVNFEHISHLALVFLLLILNM